MRGWFERSVLFLNAVLHWRRNKLCSVHIEFVGVHRSQLHSPEQAWSIDFERRKKLYIAYLYAVVTRSIFQNLLLIYSNRGYYFLILLDT